MEKIMEKILNTKGAILGVDFGDKRTGLAVCDPSRIIASAIGVVSPGGIEKTALAVADVARERAVSAIVIGLPVNMDGSEGGRAARYRKFARLLDEALEETIPICLFDERMTTMTAARFLNETNTRGAKRKEVIDALSAQIILQNFIDKLKNISYIIIENDNCYQ
jgi:putative Holliday junction resolvase